MKTIIKRKNFIMIILSCLILLFYVAFALPVFAQLGLGGFASEKMIWTGTPSRLWVGTSTGTSGIPAVGMGAPATILAPIDAYMSDTTYATLRGNVTSLSGFPSATLWFEWGYSAGSLTHITPTQTITAIGIYTADITGFDPAKDVYYRVGTNTDCTYYSSITRFLVGTTNAFMYRLLWNLLPIILAVAVLVWCIQSQHLEMFWVAVLIYVIGSTIVNVMLVALW